MKRLIVIPALLAATAALASGDGTLSLSPAVITLRGAAGQSTRQTLLLRNNTSRALSFNVQAADVIVRNGERVFAPAGSTPGSIAATAVFSQTHVRVRAGETVPVNVTLTIPAGSRERAVVALFHGTDKIVSGNMTSTASLGTLLTFALSDGVAMTAEPLHVQPQTASANLTVSQRCTNAGAEPFVTRGMLAVIGNDGRLVGKSELKPRRLLPGERVTLGAEYNAELRPGHYRLLVTYDYDGHALSQSAEVEVR
jgi:FtsP/CotA-like multicopper oxidase with cupredoxin domain